MCGRTLDGPVGEMPRELVTELAGDTLHWVPVAGVGEEPSARRVACPFESAAAHASSNQTDADDGVHLASYRYSVRKSRPSMWLVDMSYQREPESVRIEKYAARFREELFGVPVLSEREGGELFVIDGNHRRLTCITLGDDKPRACVVLRGMTVRQEAELFLSLQKERRGHTAYGQFKARVTMREPIALDIVSICKRHGKVVAECKNAKSVVAVRALETAYKRGSLDRTLAVLCAWDGENPSAFDGPPINYVSRFLAAYGEAVDTTQHGAAE